MVHSEDPSLSSVCQKVTFKVIQVSYKREAGESRVSTRLRNYTPCGVVEHHYLRYRTTSANAVATEVSAYNMYR